MTLVPSDTRITRTPWAVRLYRFTSAAAMRMMVPSSEMSRMSSSSSTTLTPAALPVFSVIWYPFRPKPPRCWGSPPERMYSSMWVRLP